jgi:hypothetical protein
MFREHSRHKPSREVEIMREATSKNFGGGVVAYREFLLRTDGAADPLRLQLAEREQFFTEFEVNRPRARYEADRDVFLRNLRLSQPEVGLDRRMLWLLATAKLNQSERFGVGLGEVYGKEQDKFDTEPERLYVQLQEHYHSRILADVISMFGLPFPTIPPRLALRATIRLFVALPHEWTLPLVGASEVVGCILFRALRDEGVRLFADDPAVAERIERLYDQILADEVGHVGFIAAKLSPRWRLFTQFLAREIAWRSILGSVPELVVLFGTAELRRLLRQRFDVRHEVETFAGRAYAAAAL